MKYCYKAVGTCAKKIEFELDEGKIHNVVFTGGCNGNLKAISKLIEGKPVEEVIGQLEGNTCGNKTTSCADQLVKALKEVFE